MGRDSLKIALILSLAFNVAVVGAVVYGFARRPVPEGFGPSPWGPPGDMLRGRASHFARQIGMPDERAARFSHIMADSSAGMRDLRVSLQRSRGELIELIGASKPDEKAIMLKADEISAIQGKLEKRLIARLLGANSMLEPKERERLMHVIRCRCMPCDTSVLKSPR